MLMQIRKMVLEDIEFALSLTTGEGWSDLHSDFVALISHTPPAAFVGEKAGTSIGMVSTVSYGDFGYFGSLIVSKEYRNRGLGRALLEHAIAYLRSEGVKVMMLDGVSSALSLYKRLGFKTVCHSLRMEGIIAGYSSGRVRSMQVNDLKKIFNIDLHNFGADHSYFLKRIIKQFPELCKVLEDEREIKGFVMGSRRGNFTRIAPCVVKDGAVEAALLIKAVSTQSPKALLRLGVLESNIEAVIMLKRLGFTVVSASYRMVQGNPNEISFSNGMYAIGSPAKG